MQTANAGKETDCIIYGKWLKLQVLFLAVCKPKFVNFGENVIPFVVCNALFRLPISRYRPILKIFAIKSRDC